MSAEVLHLELDSAALERTSVAVLSGGTSAEREVSLESVVQRRPRAHTRAAHGHPPPAGRWKTGRERGYSLQSHGGDRRPRDGG